MLDAYDGTAATSRGTDRRNMRRTARILGCVRCRCNAISSALVGDGNVAGVERVERGSSHPALFGWGDSIFSGPCVIDCFMTLVSTESRMLTSSSR